MAISTQDRIQELEAERANWLVIAEDFLNPEEVKQDATERAAELYTQITSAKAALARGEIWAADGAQPQDQYADESGGKYVDNGHGIMEPDCTSPDMAQDGEHKPSKKPSRNAGAGKRSKSSKSTATGTTPGYYRKVMSDGSLTWVIGETAPKGFEYPSLSRYAQVDEYAHINNIDDEFVRQLWIKTQNVELMLHIIILIAHARMIDTPSEGES